MDIELFSKVEFSRKLRKKERRKTKHTSNIRSVYCVSGFGCSFGHLLSYSRNEFVHFVVVVHFYFLLFSIICIQRVCHILNKNCVHIRQATIC